VIRLGLRLTLGAGREAFARLVVTAAAIAVGVTMLLAALAAVNATRGQNDRYAWLNSGMPGLAAKAAPDTDPAWWVAARDHFDGHDVGRVDIAATGPRSPVPPGLSRVPGPGEYFASPAMRKLLRDTPAPELADRFPGTLAGTIGSEALPSPDSAIIVVGHSPEELAATPGAVRIDGIATASPSSCNGCAGAGIDANGMALILSVTAGAIMFPLCVLIGTTTRLSAARREQRFAAMRLVGATPRQISVVAAVESTLAAVAGVGFGFAGFFAFRPQIAKIGFTGERFAPGDLTLGPAAVAAVALGVPVAAGIAARLALRRVRISPLGVTRRVTPAPPRVYRVVPLLLGLAELGYFVGRRPATTDGQIWAYLTGFLVVMAGLVVAGPWFTMAGARLVARHTDRPALLIAGRRLADNPKAGFRAVSGLVLALFVATSTVAIITTMTAERGRPARHDQVRHTLVGEYTDGLTRTGDPVRAAAPITDDTTARLRAVPGVRGVAVVHTNPLGTKDPRREDGPVTAGLVSCGQLAELDGFMGCAPGAVSASIPMFFYDLWDPPTAPWPAAPLTEADLAALPVVAVVVGTDGSTAAVERARTVLADAYPGERPPTTLAESDAVHAEGLDGQKQLANVVLLVTFPIAACSLAVSVAAGLAERKRPFSLLRLAGVPLAVLRRVVAVEAVVPLLAVSAVAIATGFLASQLFLTSQLGYSLAAPEAGYYVLVAAGLAAALAIVSSTLPLLKRITGPETARNE
jgi:hypothetical protein